MNIVSQMFIFKGIYNSGSHNYNMGTWLGCKNNYISSIMVVNLTSK